MGCDNDKMSLEHIDILTVIHIRKLFSLCIITLRSMVCICTVRPNTAHNVVGTQSLRKRPNKGSFICGSVSKPGACAKVFHGSHLHNVMVVDPLKVDY